LVIWIIIHIFALSYNKDTTFFNNNQKNNQTTKIMIPTKPQIEPHVMYSQSSIARRLKISLMTMQRAQKSGELVGIKRPNKSVEYLGSNVLLYWEKKRK
jgi:hypothetical protein